MERRCSPSSSSVGRRLMPGAIELHHNRTSKLPIQCRTPTLYTFEQGRELKSVFPSLAVFELVGLKGDSYRVAHGQWMLPTDRFCRFAFALTQTRSFSSSTSSLANSQIYVRRTRQPLSILSVRSSRRLANSKHFGHVLFRCNSKFASLSYPLRAATRRYSTYTTIMGSTKPSEQLEQKWTAPVVRQTFLDYFIERSVRILLA